VHKQSDLITTVSTVHEVAELLIAIPRSSFRGVALGETSVAHIAWPIQFVFWGVRKTERTPLWRSYWRIRHTDCHRECYEVRFGSHPINRRGCRPE